MHALLARAARAVAAANKTIRALILLARVICGDETPIRSGPGPKSAKKKYLQVACTNLLTCYFLGERSLPSFTGFIYSDLHGTVVVHDRYQNYDHFEGISHQLCTGHLLRDIEDAAQTYPDAIWPAQIARELRALIHAANVARDQGLATVPDEMTYEHLRLFRNGVNAGLSHVRRIPGGNNVKQPPALTLLECLKHREADVLRFLTDTAIPPTSNQAERDLRPAKTQQKISGRLRSETNTRHRYAIRGRCRSPRCRCGPSPARPPCRPGVLALGRLGVLADLGHRGLAQVDQRRPFPVAARDFVLAVQPYLPARRWSCWPAPRPPRPARARSGRRCSPATTVLCGSAVRR